jgi:hypothetical protein
MRRNTRSCPMSALRRNRQSLIAAAFPKGLQLDIPSASLRIVK